MNLKKIFIFRFDFEFVFLDSSLDFSLDSSSDSTVDLVHVWNRFHDNHCLILNEFYE